MKSGAVGTVASWDEVARVGVVRLDDGGGDVAFAGAACGSAHAGGCVPRVGLRVRIARFASLAPPVAAIVNDLGTFVHPALGVRRAPFVARIAEVRGAGETAFASAGGVGFFARACIGFAPRVGQEVWVYELTRGAVDPRGQAIFAKDGAPNDAVALADAARQDEAAAKAAIQAAKDEHERKKREPDAADVLQMIEEIRALGADVEMDECASADDVAAAESALGFALPAEYRRFVTSVGGFSIESGRTWFFYGLAGARARAREYAEEFARFGGPDDSDGSYRPQRFVVVIDEGDYANVAEGFVYDADLGAILATDGGRYLRRDDADARGYWALLIDELENARAEIRESNA